VADSDLAHDYAKLAREYADLASRCLKADEDRKAEIDALRAEIVLLHKAIEELREVIRNLREQNKDEAERSGSWSAQEALNKRELEQLRESQRDRKILVRNVLATVLAAIVLVIVTALGTVAIREGRAPAEHTAH
jgi:DNA repair exonuclease SbcCD ATPase subunit